MASPQKENGHIDIANEIADRLCSYRLNGQEWQIIWVVLRKTWGWLTDPSDKNSPKKKMDWIALSQFSKLTGINRNRCHKVLKGLIAKKIIKKTVTQNHHTIKISYGFQKNFDLWKVLPKITTVTQNHHGVLPKITTGVLPKITNTKDTITKDTITKERKRFFNQKEFDVFYSTYPKKVAKKDALIKWKKLIKSGELPELPEILAAIKNQIAWRKNSNGGFRPEWKHPAVWLNKGCWEDEIEKPEKDDPYEGRL